LTKYYWSDQIKNDEIGGTCRTHRGEEKCVQSYSRKTQKEGTSFRA